MQWSAANKSFFVFHAFVCLHVSDCSHPTHYSVVFHVWGSRYWGSGWMHFVRCGAHVKDRSTVPSSTFPSPHHALSHRTHAVLWLMIEPPLSPFPVSLSLCPCQRVLIKMHKLNNPLAKRGGKLTAGACHSEGGGEVGACSRLTFQLLFVRIFALKCKHLTLLNIRNFHKLRIAPQSTGTVTISGIITWRGAQMFHNKIS